MPMPMPMPDDEEVLGPAALYQHDHPPVRNVNVLHDEKSSFGQRVADLLAACVGSWPFIITQTFMLLGWIAVNVYLVAMERAHPGYLKSWDPYPFILLNLMLSFQAAYTGPVVMMSQNRQATKDRLMAHHDYEINLKAEDEIEVIMEHLAHQDRLILDAVHRLEALPVTPPVAEVAQKIDELLQRVEQNDRRMLELWNRLDRAEPDREQKGH